MRSIGTTCAILCQRGVADASDRVRPLGGSYSAQTDIYFGDVLFVYTVLVGTALVKAPLGAVSRCISAW
jgi:hypothetical protein